MEASSDTDTLLCEEGQMQLSWTAIAEQYRGLMIAWAARCWATAPSGESPESIADQALTRAWLALSRRGSAAFPNRAAFLAYVRTCVVHTAIDAARAHAAQTWAPQFQPNHPPLCPEHTLLAQLDSAELWRVLNGLITTEQERVILIERYVQGIPPRHILSRHPTLFVDIAAVYRAVRNLCDRLKRHIELRQLWEEDAAA